MRMYGYLKEPFKANKKDTVYKIMVHELKMGETYVYLYTSREAVFCSFDNYYCSLEDALEEWADKVDERGWIDIGEPMEDCQQDAFLPIRVKGRNIGKPQWGQYEIWKDGVWKEYYVKKYS